MQKVLNAAEYNNREVKKTIQDIFKRLNAECPAKEHVATQTISETIKDHLTFQNKSKLEEKLEEIIQEENQQDILHKVEQQLEAKYAPILEKKEEALRKQNQAMIEANQKLYERAEQIKQLQKQIQENKETKENITKPQTNTQDISALQEEIIMLREQCRVAEGRMITRKKTPPNTRHQEEQLLKLSNKISEGQHDADAVSKELEKKKSIIQSLHDQIEKQEGIENELRGIMVKKNSEIMKLNRKVESMNQQLDSNNIILIIEERQRNCMMEKTLSETKQSLKRVQANLDKKQNTRAPPPKEEPKRKRAPSDFQDRSPSCTDKNSLGRTRTSIMQPRVSPNGAPLNRRKSEIPSSIHAKIKSVAHINQPRKSMVANILGSSPNLLQRGRNQLGSSPNLPSHNQSRQSIRSSRIRSPSRGSSYQSTSRDAHPQVIIRELEHHEESDHSSSTPRHSTNNSSMPVPPAPVSPLQRHQEISLETLHNYYETMLNKFKRRPKSKRMASSGSISSTFKKSKGEITDKQTLIKKLSHSNLEHVPTGYLREHPTNQNYPFQSIHEYSRKLQPSPHMLQSIDIKQQVELKKEILCKFIRNHKKCGNDCRHAQEFYKEMGMYDNYCPKEMPNHLVAMLQE